MRGGSPPGTRPTCRDPVIRLWVETADSRDAIVGAVRESHPRSVLRYTLTEPYEVTLGGEAGYALAGRMIALPDVVVELPTPHPGET